MLLNDFGEKFRFVIVGGCATLAYLLAYWTFRQFDIAAGYASAMAYLIGVVTSYLGHAIFTFQAPVKDSAQAMRYLIATLVGASLTAMITVTGTHLGASDLMIMVIVVMCIPAINYVLFKRYVYMPNTIGINDDAL